MSDVLSLNTTATSTVLPTSRTRIPIMGVTDIRYQPLMLLRDTNNNMCVLDNRSRRTL